MATKRNYAQEYANYDGTEKEKKKSERSLVGQKRGFDEDEGDDFFGWPLPSFPSRSFSPSPRLWPSLLIWKNSILGSMRTLLKMKTTKW